MRVLKQKKRHQRKTDETIANKRRCEKQWNLKNVTSKNKRQEVLHRKQHTKFDKKYERKKLNGTFKKGSKKGY